MTAPVSWVLAAIKALEAPAQEGQEQVTCVYMLLPLFLPTLKFWKLNNGCVLRALQLQYEACVTKAFRCEVGIELVPHHAGTLD